MQKKGSIFLLIVLLNCFVSVSAQTNMFMKVMDPGQINGESQAAQYLNWIDIYGYNAGSNTPVSIGGGSGGTTGNTSTKEFTFSMCVDKSLNYLKRQMYIGSTLQTVQIDFTRPGTSSPTLSLYYKLEFADAYISKIEEAGTTADGRPLCNISIIPVKFRYTYWAPSTGGPAVAPVVFGWDQAANIAW